MALVLAGGLWIAIFLSKPSYLEAKDWGPKFGLAARSSKPLDQSDTGNLVLTVESTPDGSGSCGDISITVVDDTTDLLAVFPIDAVLLQVRVNEFAVTSPVLDNPYHCSAMEIDNSDGTEKSGPLKDSVLKVTRDAIATAKLTHTQISDVNAKSKIYSDRAARINFLVWTPDKLVRDGVFQVSFNGNVLTQIPDDYVDIQYFLRKDQYAAVEYHDPTNVIVSSIPEQSQPGVWESSSPGLSEVEITGQTQPSSSVQGRIRRGLERWSDYVGAGLVGLALGLFPAAAKHAISGYQVRSVQRRSTSTKKKGPNYEKKVFLAASKTTDQLVDRARNRASTSEPSPIQTRTQADKRTKPAPSTQSRRSNPVRKKRRR